MVARTRKQRQRRYGLVGHLAMLVLVSLFLTLLLVLVTAQGISATDNAAYNTFQRMLPQEALPTATNTPSLLPTNTPAPPTATPLPPTATPVPVGTDTPTTAVIPTGTPVATSTATTTSNGGGGGGQGQSGPQSTEVALGLPTVGAGSGSSLQGLSPASFGTNGLLVATTLGCIIGLLGIVIGGTALYRLVQSGYGPFLLALTLGKRRTLTALSRRFRGQAGSGPSSFDSGYAGNLSSPDSGWTNRGEFGSDNPGRR